MQTARKIKPEFVPRKQPKKRQRNQLRAVKTKRRLRLRIPDSSSLFSVFLIFSTILAVGLIFNVSQRALIAQGALQNKQLEDKFEKEQLKRQKLLVAKIELNAPGRIEKIAIEKLGMVNPAEVSYLELPNKISKQEEVKSLSSSKSKKDSPWRSMAERIVGKASMSSLRELSLNGN